MPGVEPNNGYVGMNEFPRGVLLAAKAALLASIAPCIFAMPASAQSFDCAKAGTAIERAICANPALIAQDNALAGLYARLQFALRDDAPQLDALRQGQRRWIAERNKACTDSDAAKLSACLLESYRGRFKNLAAANVAPSAVAAAPAPVAPAPVTPVVSPVAPVPVVAAPPAAAVPAIPPVPVNAVARARFEQNALPANSDGESLLRVDVPGRYSLRSQSPSGIGIQLVDMIAGPGESAGVPGVRDGRIDVLLDRGTYKVRTTTAKNASGTANLSVLGFRELATDMPRLADDSMATTSLDDLTQRSWRFRVDRSGPIALEAVGRALKDLRLWRDGTDLADIVSDIALIEPQPGHAMTRVRLEGEIEAGDYIITAYGGAPSVWSDGNASLPLHVRAGLPRYLATGAAQGAIGVFGSVRFTVAPGADSFRLALDKPAAARLDVTRGKAQANAIIEKNSRDVFAIATLAAEKSLPAIVEISGREGQAFDLRALRASLNADSSARGAQLAIVDVAGEGGDEARATAVLVRVDSSRDARKGRILESDAVKIEPAGGWRSTFNLRGDTGIIFQTLAAGPIAIRAQGPALRASISTISGGAPPRADGRMPAVANLDAGFYMLRIEPVNGASGILDLTIGAPGLVPPLSPRAPQRTAIGFGVQNFPSNSLNTLITGYGPAMLVGARFVALPVDLSNGAVPLVQFAASDVVQRPVPAPTPAPRVTPPPANKPLPQQGAKPAPNVQAAPRCKTASARTCTRCCFAAAYATAACRSDARCTCAD